MGTVTAPRSTTPKAVRGRPECLPWKVEMPFLIGLRRTGATYTELANVLSERYKLSVTPQTVRIRVSPFASKKVEQESQRAREGERARLEEQDSLRLATWLVDNPAATKRDASAALALPLSRVEDLTALARSHVNGYLIPPAKPGRQQFTDDSMLSALKVCGRDLGIAKKAPLSQGRYEDWRNSLTRKRKLEVPSPIAYRRRFGTWTQACRLAGLTANELPRTYDGLSVQDIVVHIAVWLRSLSQGNEGLVDASQAEYRLWLRAHQEAPSEELIRLRGTWAHLLSAASVLEKSVKKLPVPKPVGTEGRLKSSTR